MDTTIPMETDTPTENPLKGFLTTLGHALLHPARFFREDLGRFNTSEALAFGIGNAWLASAVAFFFQTFNTLVLTQLFEKWVQRLLASEEAFRLLEFSGKNFVWDAGALVIAPFLLLLQAVLGTVVLYLFARLFVEDDPGAPESVTFTTCLKIKASSYVSQWYSVVPFFGPVLAFVVGLVLLVTGVRERFQVSTRRAVVVVLAPYFLVFLAVMAFSALLLLALSQFPLQELLDLDALRLGFPRT